MLMFISLTITGGFCGLLFFYINEDVSSIEIAALCFYFIMFMGSLEQYAVAISNLRSAVYEYQAFQDFIDRLSEVIDVDDPIDIPMRTNPTIEFRSVTFSYEGKDILNDVSFKIEGGQTLGLVG